MNDSDLKQQNFLKRAGAILNPKLAVDFFAWVLILFLLLMLIPQRPWLIEMLCHFLHLALLPAILIFVVMLVKREWRRAVLWAVPTLAFVFLFGGLFLPSLEKHNCSWRSTATCKHLRVMTFNLLGNPLGNREKQIDVLRDSGADIIALQEVNQDCINAIEAQIAELYPYRVLFPSGIAGTGIISKYPILSHEFIRLTDGFLYHTKAVIDVDGLPVTIISAHPPPPFSIDDFRYKGRRYKEITGLIDMLPDDGPAFIMGDFNLTDQSSDYRVLTGAGLRDTWREVGWGFGITWPERILSIKGLVPIMRIDYIWHTDEIDAISAWAGPWTKSDHRAVIADLAIVSSE